MKKKCFIYAKCLLCDLKDLANLAALASNQARNFYQQAARALVADSGKKSKEDKKGSFNEPVKILVNNLGGDSANLTCSGKSISSNDTVKGDTQDIYITQR